MTLFWIAWGIDAIVALVALFFFFIGLADGSVSATNMGLWMLMLAVLAGVLLGSIWLKNHDHLTLAKTLVLLLAVPATLFMGGIIIATLSGTRWN